LKRYLPKKLGHVPFKNTGLQQVFYASIKNLNRYDPYKDNLFMADSNHAIP
jgi:hypothetical protein